MRSTSATFSVRLAGSPAAIVRIVNIIHDRGSQLVALQYEAASDGSDGFCMVKTKGGGANLLLQLERNPDVIAVYEV